MSSAPYPEDGITSEDSNYEVGNVLPISERPVQTRDISPLIQRSTIETMLSNIHAPLAGVNLENPDYDISPEAMLGLRDGRELDYFTEHCPEDVLPILKGAAVAPVGCIKAKDVDVLQAFGRETMLTRHLDTADDPAWHYNWQNALQKRSYNSSRNVSVGWEETVTLGAYVVYLKNLANPEHGDLVQLLLQKIGSGAAPKSVWGYDSVRAVINYHWQHWAKRLLLISFVLFLIWTTSFSAYLVLYINSPLFGVCSETPDADQTDSTGCRGSESAESGDDLEGTPAPLPTVESKFEPQRRLAMSNAVHLNMESNNARRKTAAKKSGSEEHFTPCNETIRLSHGAFTNKTKEAVATRVLSIVSFAVMCPFAIEEYYTMVTLGLEWFCVANLIDFSTHTLQTLIFIFHLADYGLDKEWFALILTAQTVLLSMRVLRFFKLLGEGTTFLDTAIAVIYDVRYWIGYIVLTGVAASLSLGILYKPNQHFQSRHRKDFSSVTASLVTTFQIIFGTFDISYIFDAGEYEWVMFIFFFGFQVLMTITVLNLLIAAMSESYSKVAADQVMRMYRSRAQVIAEFETLKLPRWIKRRSKKYIHFLVVEKKSESHLTPAPSFKPTQSQKHNTDATCDAIDELRDEVRNMQVKLDELMKAMRNSPAPLPPPIVPRPNAN